MSESESTELIASNQVKQSKSKIAILALLISLISLLASSVSYLYIQQLATQKTTQLQSIMHDQFDKLQTQIDSLQTEQAEQTTQQLQTKQQITQLQNTFKSGSIQWQLSRLDYLLHLANYQLLYLHDLSTAIHLVQTAKTEVIHANKPQWLPLANALQQDLDALNALPNTPITDILSQITGINTQIQALPLITNPIHQTENAHPKEKIEPVQTNSSPTQWAWWKARFERVWKELSHVLIIRHHNQVVTPLIDPIQQQYLRENLRLLTFQMKWAVLHHNNQSYQTALTQFSTWLHRYFDIDTTQTKAILNDIQQLQTISLTQTLPTLDRSLNAFDQLRQATPTPLVKKQLAPNIEINTKKPPLQPSKFNTPDDTIEVTAS